MERDLIFKYSNLKYDIDNIAYIIGERVEEPGLRQRITDVTQLNNEDRVKRMLDLAHAEVNEMCYPYTKVVADPETESDDNDYNDETQYVVSLNMPADTAESTFNVMKQHINEYFIWRVMLDWLALTAPNMLKEFDDKLKGLEYDIKSDISARMKITHIKPSVF